MESQSALAAAATLVALAFFSVTIDRWTLTRSRHELAWGAALLLFAGASGALWVGAAVGWSMPVFRAFYLLGAIMNVPVLALGTVYLVAGRERGDRTALTVALLAAFATGVLVVTPASGTLEANGLPQGSDVFGALPRVLAAVASGLGAMVIFVGSLWSMIRRRSSRSIAVSGLIMAGTVVLSLGGLFNSVADEMTAFAVSLVLGISLLFAGFLAARLVEG